MERTLTRNFFVYLLPAVFIMVSGASAYWQQPYILWIPVLLVVSIYLIQHPKTLFYLLVVSIPWSVEFNFTPTIGSDLPDEPLMLLTAFAALLMFIYYGRRNKLRGLHPLFFLLLLQLCWTSLTVFASTDYVSSFKYLLAKCWYLMAFVVMPVWLFKDLGVLKRSVLLLLGSMLCFVFFALIRHAQFQMTFENVNDALEPFFRNHVNYSALLVCMVPLLLAVIRLSKSYKLKRCTWLLLFITVVALYFSYARGAWMALLTGLLAYPMVRKRMLLPVFVLAIGLCIGFVSWLKSNDRFLKYANDYNTTIFHTDFREHLVATYYMKDVSTAERFYRWIAGIRMADENWRTGFGPTSFYRQYKSYTIPAFRTWVSRNEEQSTVHNYFLLMLIEQGVVGLLLLLVLIGALFWYAQAIYHRGKDRLVRASVGAVASILVMVCTVNFLSDLIETDKVGSIFYLCIAAMIVLDRMTREKRQATSY